MYALAVASIAGLLCLSCDDGPTSAGGSGGSSGTTTTSSGAMGGFKAGGSGTLGGGGVEVGAAPTGGAASTGPTPSPGCVDGRGLSEGEHSFMLEGLSRRYVLRLPVGYTRDKAWPLVLALHPNGGDVNYWDASSGSQNIRGPLQNDAILIIAEAIGGNWRDYNMPPETWPPRIESELSYFNEVLTLSKADLCINEDAIFSMGFSGGGSFSGVLGCRRTDIRAIAAGGAVIYFDEVDCIHTPAAWITIGAQELEPAREQFRDFFRDRAACLPTAMPTLPSPCTAYDQCASETPVHYCPHPNGHIWPDFASEAAWAFFARFVEPR